MRALVFNYNFCTFQIFRKKFIGDSLNLSFHITGEEKEKKVQFREESDEDEGQNHEVERGANSKGK